MLITSAGAKGSNRAKSSVTLSGKPTGKNMEMNPSRSQPYSPPCSSGCPNCGMVFEREYDNLRIAVDNTDYLKSSQLTEAKN